MLYTCFHPYTCKDFKMFSTPNEIDNDIFIRNINTFPYWWEMRGESIPFEFNVGDVIKQIGFMFDEERIIIEVINTRQKLKIPEFCYKHHKFEKNNETKYFAVPNRMLKWFIGDYDESSKQPFNIEMLLDGKKYIGPFTTVDVKNPEKNMLEIRVTRLYGSDDDIYMMPTIIFNIMHSYCRAIFSDQLSILQVGAKYWRMDPDRTAAQVLLKILKKRKPSQKKK